MDDDKEFAAAQEIAARPIYSFDDDKGADMIQLAMALLALRQRVAELEERLEPPASPATRDTRS